MKSLKFQVVNILNFESFLISAAPLFTYGFNKQAISVIASKFPRERMLYFFSHGYTSSNRLYVKESIRIF